MGSQSRLWGELTVDSSSTPSMITTTCLFWATAAAPASFSTITNDSLMVWYVGDDPCMKPQCSVGSFSHCCSVTHTRSSDSRMSCDGGVAPTKCGSTMASEYRLV